MKTQTAFIGLVLCFLVNVRECSASFEYVENELIASIFPFQQTTCIIENFEFEYDDIGNDVDGTGKEYASRMHFPSMTADNSMENSYYKFPLSRRPTITIADTIHPTHQSYQPSNAAKQGRRNVAPPKFAFHFVNSARPSDQSTAQAKKTSHTISAAQMTKNPTQTKQVANIAELDPSNVAHSFIREPQQNYPYHQRTISMNPSPEGITSRSYYSPVTHQPNYMVRPIYVRLVKPMQGNFLVDQMALNRQTEIPHTHHATLQWW